VGGDKSFDTRDFVAGDREIGVTPHMAAAGSKRTAATLAPAMASMVLNALEARTVDPREGWLW
jgi:hypothetical protein